MLALELELEVLELLEPGEVFGNRMCKQKLQKEAD